MIMKAKRFFMGMMLALCLAAPAVASGLGDIRVNARFLTDRMAFELNLTQTQYNDLYEVNYDFFSGIDPYVSAMARQEAYALDAYYRYLDERNDDLRWVLSSAEYVRFMALEYFFRPVVCALHGVGVFFPSGLCLEPRVQPAYLSGLSQPEFLLFRASGALPYVLRRA